MTTLVAMVATARSHSQGDTRPAAGHQPGAPVLFCPCRAKTKLRNVRNRQRGAAGVAVLLFPSSFARPSRFHSERLHEKRPGIGILVDELGRGLAGAVAGLRVDPD